MAAICLAIGAGLLAAFNWLRRTKIRGTNPPLWVVLAVVVLLPLTLAFMVFANWLVDAAIVVANW